MVMYKRSIAALDSCALVLIMVPLFDNWVKAKNLLSCLI
jgi:hypothetical protein